jgi:hypothetical protein
MIRLNNRLPREYHETADFGSAGRFKQTQNVRWYRLSTADSILANELLSSLGMNTQIGVRNADHCPRK